MEVKSPLLTFDNFWKQWKYHATCIKLCRPGAEGHAFERLLLCICTPLQLRIYEHDQLLVVSSKGLATMTKGFDIQLDGPQGEHDWRLLD